MNIFYRKSIGILLTLVCLFAVMVSPVMAVTTTVPDNFSFSSPKKLGTYSYNSNLKISWTASKGAKEYKLSIRDLTTDKIVKGYENFSLGNVTSHSVPSSKLSQSHKYRIYVGAYATSTSTSGTGITLEPIYVNSSTYSKISEYVTQGNIVYGQFGYKDNSDATITLDPVWKNDNIKTYSVTGIPKITSITVHVNAKPMFDKAFDYIRTTQVKVDSTGTKKYLKDLIQTYDGTFVSRHKNWKVTQGISNHAWGTAIDINASNHTGYINPTNNPYDYNNLLWVNAFAKSGFYWGNSYSDSMHYETANR